MSDSNSEKIKNDSNSEKIKIDSQEWIIKDLNSESSDDQSETSGDEESKLPDIKMTKIIKSLIYAKNLTLNIKISA